MYFFYLPSPSGRVDLAGCLYIRLTPLPAYFQIVHQLFPYFREDSMYGYRLQQPQLLQPRRHAGPPARKLVEYLGSGGRFSQYLTDLFCTERACVRSKIVQDSVVGPNSAIPSQVLPGSGKVHKTNTASLWKKNTVGQHGSISNSHLLRFCEDRTPTGS